MVECYSNTDVPVVEGGAGSFVIYGYSTAYSERCHIVNCHSNFSGHYGAEIYRYSKGCSVEGGSYLNAYTAGLSTNAFDPPAVNTNFNVVFTGVTTMTTINRSGGSHRGLDCVGANILATGCSFFNHTMGVFISTDTDNCSIVANHIYNATGAGIRVYGSHNIVTNNYIRMYNGTSGNCMEVSGDYNIITNNLMGHCRFGVYMSGNAEYNTFRDNRFFEIPSLHGRYDVMYNNISETNSFPTIVLPFINGTTFLSSGNAWGWEIDADTEYAVVSGYLPIDVQQVIRIKIVAVSLVTETDGMRLEFTGYGGASNEPYNQATITAINETSVTLNFATDDYIHWTIDYNDDTDIVNLSGGDFVQFKVKHEAVGNGDCATDAVFLCAIIEYG